MSFEELSGDVNVDCNNITKSIIRAAEESIKRTSGKFNVKYNKAWWNEEVELCIKERKRALDYFRKYPTPANHMEYKKKRAVARKAIKQAKKQSCTIFVSSISSSLI